jgi:hypothetical protein
MLFGFGKLKGLKITKVVVDLGITWILSKGGQGKWE